MVEKRSPNWTTEWTELKRSICGMEKKFFLRERFSEYESEEYAENVTPSGAKMRAYAEPYVAWNVSVRKTPTESPIGTLHYGLSRSRFWQGQMSANEETREQIRRTFENRLRTDLEEIDRGNTPETLSKRIYQP